VGLARALVASGDWYERLWQRRDRLAQKPALLLWGMKDPGFGPAFLARWTEALPTARGMRFPDAGHFVPEEVDSAVLASAIHAHIAESPAPVSAESGELNVRDETTTSVS